MEIKDLNLSNIDTSKIKVDAETALILLITVLEMAEEMDEQLTLKGRGHCNGLHAGNCKCSFSCPMCNAREMLFVRINPRGGMADAADLKSAEDKTHTGSSPVGGNERGNTNG